MDAGILIEEARKIQQHSYSPYSGFKVGAALLGKSGKIYRGTNVENSSYGLSVCAERIAVFNAVSAGEREFKAIAISSSGDGYIYPCGACLQVLAEFGRDLQVIVSNENDEYRQFVISDLIPQAFIFKAQEE